MQTEMKFVSNGDGWSLAIKHSFDSKRQNPALNPLLIVPGYGMNSYIFGYHPNGMSLEEFLVNKGFDVYAVNFRTQGESVCEGGKSDYGFKEIALCDLPVAIDFVLSETHKRHKKVDVIGCSLGGTFLYIYAALLGTKKLGSLVTMGSPLNWIEINPLLRIAFGSPKLAGMLKLSHTRELAKYALPVMKKLPGLLSIYLHPEIVDLSHPEMLVHTIEDPNPQLNREISEWIVNRDLIIDGKNISEQLQSVTNPLFVMLSNADGIVPDATALCAIDAVSSKVKDSYVSGNDKVKMAHADMYISYYSQEMVFTPLADWLSKQK